MRNSRKVLGVVVAAGLLAAVVAVPANAAESGGGTRVVVDDWQHYQRIDGFGISQAFGTANQIRYLGDTPARKAALDLLFDPTAGAGFSILRNLIPSDPNHTMEPTAPASPDATPTYVWDGTSDATDWGQLWLAKQAK